MDIRQSSKKVRFVLEEVRNTNINDALSKLSFMNKKAAKCIHQTITSALNNLQQSETDFDADNLYIKEAFVDQGLWTSLSRGLYRPGAMNESISKTRRNKTKDPSRAGEREREIDR